MIRGCLLKDGTDIKLERPHAALGPKLSDPIKTARSNIVCFLGFKVQQTVLNVKECSVSKT